MTHDSLLAAVYSKLSTVPDMPTIFYPNTNQTTVPSEYVAAYVIPAPTENATIDGLEYQYGIIQIDCVTLSSVGEIKAAQLAEKIIAAFKVGTQISGVLKVHRPSYASAGIQTGDGHYKIPVTVRYQCYS